MNPGHVTIENHTGNKYRRTIYPCDGKGQCIDVDIYSVLTAWRVTNPGIGQAVKKLLVPGGRGVKSSSQDIQEAIDALYRALEIEKIEERVAEQERLKKEEQARDPRRPMAGNS